MYRTFGFIAVVAILTVTGQARAQVLTPSFTDLWDIGKGATITSNSPVLNQGGGTVSDIRNMFGGNYGTITGDWGNTLFADLQSPGTVDWVQWQTPQPVIIKSFSLFAFQDVNPDHRNFSRFSLFYYDTVTSNWVPLYTIHPPDPEGTATAPPGTYIDKADYPSYYLALTADVTPTTAQNFRAEFVNVGIEGPRIVELDGFGTNSPLVTPEPSTLVIWGVGVCGFLAYAWRKRRPLSAGAIRV